MFDIDFSKIPDIDKKLSVGEIAELNGIFSDPSIQQKLEEIEAQRKLRAKWKIAVYGITFLVGLLLSLMFWGGNIIAGFFYTIVDSNGDSTMPVVWTTIGTYGILMGILYANFRSKIEIPLKTDVLAKLCPILYSKFEYSHDRKYSFDDVYMLRGKSFLNSFDRIKTIEDSIYFPMTKDGKNFFVHGFELETTETRTTGSGKNRRTRTVTTNHDYLIKAEFPMARIPLKDDLFIVSDVENKPFSTKFVNSNIFFIIICILIMLVPLSGIILENWFNLETLAFTVTPVLIFIIIVGILVYFQKRKKQKPERIELENVEFEKRFDVHCNDPITSRMIITPAFMDRIVSFVEKTGNNYEFLFCTNTMYVKRKINGTYLESGTERDMTKNLTGYVQFYTDMREIMQLVYDMNLMYLSKTDINYVPPNPETAPIHNLVTQNLGTGIMNGNTGIAGQILWWFLSKSNGMKFTLK